MKLSSDITKKSFSSTKNGGDGGDLSMYRYSPIGTFMVCAIEMISSCISSGTLLSAGLSYVVENVPGMKKFPSSWKQ